jgi:hypothetical protein
VNSHRTDFHEFEGDNDDKYEICDFFEAIKSTLDSLRNSFGPWESDDGNREIIRGDPK